MRNGAKTNSLYRPGGMDRVLLSVILVLTAVGLLSVYSAGSEKSVELFGNPHGMFLHHLQRVALGVGLMLLIARVPYLFWRSMVLPALALSVVLLLLVFVPQLSLERNNAHRWLLLGSFQFQPSELARYALIGFVAWWGMRQGTSLRELTRGFAPPMGVAIGVAFLVLLQPDFSTAAMLVITVMAMLFMMGARFSHLLLVTLPAVLAASIVVWSSPYKRLRVLTFMSPESDPSGSGYQILQSYIAHGSGGLFGVGPGGSRQKLSFLPDSHTDFIFSIIGEEWGLLGTMLILVLFLFLVYRGFRIARRSPEPFGGYLAAGITFTIGLYAFVNMAVTVGRLPATGLPLPLISYGGTAMLVTLAALGVLLNISRHVSLTGAVGDGEEQR